MMAKAQPAVAKAQSAVALADLVALTKPKITRLVVFTAAVGMWLAPAGSLTALRVVMTMLGTVLVVSAANTLNMFLERDIDGLMGRTASRPLPAGRLQPGVALGFGLLLAVTALPILSMAVNPLTALLGLLALVIYVAMYTPLKQRSWTAVLVGAVPGAMPPLMGWTAATGRIGGAGLVLFAIMFVWQIPHTLAITLFRDEEYRRAGFQTLPVQHGMRATRWHTLAYAPLLVLVTLLPVALGVAGAVYLSSALVLGAGFVGLGVAVVRERQGVRWAKNLFVYSIIYLTVLFGVLLATASHGRV